VNTFEFGVNNRFLRSLLSGRHIGWNAEKDTVDLTIPFDAVI
jgi:hypothetical protein